MEADNNFDSDTSESWSLIDMNCERSTDINLMDEIGAEALEVRLEEVENGEKCSALPGNNGSPKNIITGNDGNIASGNGYPKPRPHFQRLYTGPLFEDESDSELYAPSGPGKLNLNYGGNVDTETKDVEDDTDGISVISESEINEGKVNAYESDEGWDEKPSDSDANENPSSNDWRKGKTPKASLGESSEDNVNSGMAPEGGTDAEKKENEKPRNRPAYPHVYRFRRNHRPGFAMRLTMAVILSGVSYIMLGQLCGDEETLRTANNMAQTVRKLQKENLILHSRLTQLNRAVLARGVNKLDLKEETEPSCLKHEPDCRKINLKLYERNMDEDNYDYPHPRNKKSLDFSIPLNHPKNVLAFKQILVGSEMFLAKKTDENFEPFNLTKYVEALVSGQSTPAGTPSPSSGNDGKPIKPVELGNEESSEPEDGKPIKPVKLENEKSSEPMDEEPDQKHEELEDTNCEMDGSTFEDDESQRDNCLAIEEKDLSQFRWFILKDKPKCLDIEVEDLEELESDCLYRIPLEKIHRKVDTDAFEDSDVTVEEADFLEEKDDEFIPSKTDSASEVNSKSTNDQDNLEEKKPSEKDSQTKKMKKPEVNPTPGIRNFDYGQSSPKKKDNMAFDDIYLKYFEKVEKEIKENNGGTGCFTGKNPRCDFKFMLRDDDKQAQNGERKNTKKNQSPKGKRDKPNFRFKKWKTCSMKPGMKCGNNPCDDCACKSGDWFSKYTLGREKCRRDQKISDWQFDRAKSREYSRMGDAFWQFSRAYARQNRRMSPYSRKKKAKNFSGKGPGSKPDSKK